PDSSTAASRHSPPMSRGTREAWPLSTVRPWSVSGVGEGWGDSSGEEAASSWVGWAVSVPSVTTTGTPSWRITVAPDWEPPPELPPPELPPLPLLPPEVPPPDPDPAPLPAEGLELGLAV